MIFIFLQLFLLSQQCDFNYSEAYDENFIFIQSESVGITLFKGAASFQIYVMQNESYAIYNTSLGSIFHLSFDNDFKINDKNLTAIEGKGNILLPSFLKMFFANHELCTSVVEPTNVEPIELCFDFTAERISLKVITGILTFMLFLTNYKDIQKKYRNNSFKTPNRKTFSDKFISWRKLSTIPETSV